MVGVSIYRKVVWGATYTNLQTSHTLPVCFIARAGRTYQTLPIVEGRRWHPQIVDESTWRRVDRRCPEHFTLAAYSGPNRAEGETALIEPDGLALYAIDGTPIPDAMRFKVLPGPRLLAFRLDDLNPIKQGLPGRSQQPIPICVTLGSGRA